MTSSPTRNFTKGASVDWSTGVVCGVHRSVTGVPLRTLPSQKNASLLERLSVSRFPFRHPVLHGLLLELRSFRHRIRLLWQLGGTRLLETGSVYQQTSHPLYLVLNRQTRLRTLGIQHLLAEQPWVSGEDCRLFLMGWNKGWESSEASDMANSSEDMRGSFAYPDRGNSMPPLVVQQSTKRDPQASLPSQE